jgi:hypothetical protein
VKSFEDKVKHVDPAERGSMNHIQTEKGHASGRFGGARDMAWHNGRADGECCTHEGGIKSV